MKRLILGLVLILSPGYGAKLTSDSNPSNIRIVPVRPTPEPDNIATFITFPKESQIVYNQPIGVQLRVQGYPLGVMSDFDRKKQIYNDPMGQSMLVIIDNHHPIEIYKSFVDSLDRNNIYFDLTLNTTIPYQLEEGMHVIRTFPSRSFGEGLKEPGAFAASIFYIGERKNNLTINLNAPYLTYNEPLETLSYNEVQPLLLDFYITNVRLSNDGYKVKVIIDKNIERILTSWTPYYIYGLKRGIHTIRLQLLNAKNEVQQGLFNDVTRRIHVD